ncbi:hypothetical protein [Saccharothrix obliqua]|uniref:hypothetical protein n=1 Tax=Saccharothrix obliqua TaxID=2861747 RepID=UPI001C5F90F0|nr:hypothetical protein [Saccharothrix obliqua]MBW4717797.1 hypothetical protein [Saccharothrix obliqua]
MPSSEAGRGGEGGAVSRRTILVVGGGGLLLAGLPRGSSVLASFVQEAEPTLRLDLLRREDMLKLHYDFYNLQVSHASDPPTLVVVDGTRQSLVVVRFDSQHLMEETTFVSTQGGSPPPPEALPAPGEVLTKAVEPSRIAFLVPPTVKALPYTEDGLLDWSGWVMRVVPVLAEGAQQAPTELQTDLRLVDWLHLTPEQVASWAHVRHPVEAGGRTELWHTRLAARDERGRPDPFRGPNPVRAVAADDVPADTKFKSLIGYGGNRDVPKRLVSQSNAVEPVKAELLLLSAQGSSVELAGEWGGDLPIAQWRHRSSLGRDNYVRIEERGFLFPYGHRAVLVTETERQIMPDGAAHLIQRAHIRVQQPVKDYSENAFPFTSVRILLAATPNLAPVPEKIPARKPGEPPTSEARTFWVQYLPEGSADPIADRRDIPFPMAATDWAGNRVEFTAFLAFVHVEDAYAGDALAELRAVFGADRYRPGDLGARRTHALGGQEVAFAPPAGGNPAARAAPAEGSTVLPTAAMYLSSAAGDPAGPWRWLAEPNFVPRMLAAEVRLPSVETLVGKEVTAAIGYDPDYVAGSFERVKGEAFARVQRTVAQVGELVLKLATPGATLPTGGEVAAQFGSVVANVGGVASPDLVIGGLSRALGPLSGPAEVVTDIVRNGRFDPKKFFAEGAKLLGGISIGDLIGGVDPVDPTKPIRLDLDSGPRIVTTRVHPDGDVTKPPEAVSTTVDWTPRLPSGLTAGVFWPKTDDGRTTSLTLHGETRTALGDGATTYVMTGDLRDFALELVKGDDPVLSFVKLTFRRFAFEARDNAKPNIHVELAGVAFKGPLDFVNTLQRFLVSSGRGPAVDVQPVGISAGWTLAIPDVAIGVFTLQHLAFSAALHLPFDGGPARARFAFCSREQPFTLTVSLFGGGGFFALAVGADGFEMLEAAIEFGGSVAFNLGVASGGVSVLAGIYFKLELTDGRELVTLTGYLRANGQLSVLGLITISAEFYLGLSYTSEGNRVEGEASLTVEIDILFFHKSVTLRVHKSFAGPSTALTDGRAAAAPPKFGDLMGRDDWHTYCDAFAA